MNNIKLQGKIHLISLVIAILFFGLVILTYNFSREQIIDNTRSSFEMKKREIQLKLEHFFMDLKPAARTIRIVAQYEQQSNLLPFLKEVLSDYPNLFGAGIVLWNNGEPKDSHFFYAYKSLDNQGNFLESTFTQEEYSYLQYSWFKAPFYMKKAIWSPAYYDPCCSNLILKSYSIPIYNDEQLIGIAKVDIALQSLNSILLETVIGNQGFNFIKEIEELYQDSLFYDTARIRSDNLLLISNLDMEQTDLNLYSTDDYLDPELLETLKSENLVLIELSDYLFQYFNLPSLGLTIGMVANKEEIFQPLHTLSQTFIVFTTLTILICFIIAVVLTKRMVRPINELIDFNQRIKIGQEVPQLTVKGKDEISQLAQSFKETVDNLYDYYQKLEYKNHFMHRISELSMLFMKSGDFKSKLQSFLEKLGQSVQCKRLLFYQYMIKEDSISYLHSDFYWTKEPEEVSSLFPSKYLDTTKIYMQWREQLEKNLPVKVQVDQLSEEQKKAFIDDDISKIINIPVQVKNQFYGMLSFQFDKETEHYFNEEVYILFLAAYVLGAAIEMDQVRSEIQSEKLSSEKANRLKTEFLHTVSHGLRTPLNTILGFVQLLSRKEIDPGAKEMLGAIYKSSNNLKMIIDDILDISQLEIGDDKLSFSIVDLNDLLLSLENIYRPLAEGKNVSFLIKVATDCPRLIYSDKVRLKHVLSNILSNAVKFTNKGYVQLNAFMKEEKLFFSVSDTGQGISEEILPHILEPFYQWEEKEQPLYEGTGLGLAISDKIIKLFNGEIWVQSAENQGTTITFYIPIVKIKEDHFPKIPKNKDYSFDKRFDSDIKSILIAEDEKDVRDLITQLLQSEKRKLYFANNGVEALNILEQNRVDAIIMDMKMPVMDGFTATKMIKKETRFEHIPIVAFTAYAMDSEKLQCYQAGCDDFLSKPIVLEEFKRVMEKWLQQPIMENFDY